MFNKDIKKTLKKTRTDIGNEFKPVYQNTNIQKKNVNQKQNLVKNLIAF